MALAKKSGTHFKSSQHKAEAPAPRTKAQRGGNARGALLFAGTVLVLIIVIAAFVLVPAIVPESGAGLDTTFGYYGNTPISYVSGNYFYNAYAQYSQYYGSISGAGFERYIWRQAFDMAAVRAGIIEEAQLSGFTPPDSIVDKSVAQLPDLQENGRFSAVRYRSLDSTTRARIWKDQQEQLMINRYLSDAGGLLVPSGEAAFVADMGSVQRTFDIAAFPISGYPAEQVSSYIDAHKDLFTTVHLFQITQGSERDAQKILDQVKGGASFEDAARSQSTDSNADRGGDMGQKMAYELASEIPNEDERKAVLALAAEEYSGIVKTPSGWAFFRAEEAPRPADSADTAVIDKARSYITSFERGTIEDYYIGQAESFNEDVREFGFDTACTNAGIEKSTIGPLPLNYGDADLFPAVSSYSVSALSGASTNENFWKTAFTAEVGVPARPIVLGDNILILFPREETTLDADEKSSIENYYRTSAVNAEGELSVLLLKNKRFRDRFDVVFAKLYGE